MKMVPNEKVMKAMETLEKIRSDPKEREIYDSIQKAKSLSRKREMKSYEEGLTKGKRKGKREGMKEGKREIIRKMIIEQIPMEQIYKITELNKKEIEEIRKSI